jgi:PAS domain S-box-containing protein
MKSNLECQVNLGRLSGFEKEQLLEQLLKDSPDVIVFLATDFTLRMANQSFTQYTGLTSDEVIGNSGLALFPGLNKQLGYLLQKSRLTKQPVFSKANLKLPSKSGKTLIWQATINPLFENDVLNGWLLIFKKTGQAFPASILRISPCGLDHQLPVQTELVKVLQVIDGLLPFGIWECNLVGALLDVSGSFLENTGLTWEEAKDYGWTSLAPPEDQAKLLTEWQECFKQNSSWSFQYQIRCRNGIRRVISSQALPIRNQEGQIVSWMGLNFDITQQQREQEENWQALQIGREFFKTVINHAAIGLAMYSGDELKLQWSNPNFQGFIEEANYAQAAAGIQLKHDLPYVEDFKLDELAAMVLTQRIPQPDLAVEFPKPRQSDRAHWRVGVVPVWSSAAQTPDLLVTAINISSQANAIPEQDEVMDNRMPATLNFADWEAVIDQLAEGLIVLNQAGQVVAINQKAVDLLGVSPDSCFTPGLADDFAPLHQLQTTDGTKIAPEDWPHIRVLRGETLEHYEAELCKPGQTEVRQISFTGTTLHGRESQSDLAVLTCSDRTETRQLIHANDQLLLQAEEHQELIRRLIKATPQLETDLTQLYTAANMYEILNAAINCASQALKADGGAINLFIDQGGNQEVYQLWKDEATMHHLNLSEMPHTKLVIETKEPVYFTPDEADGQETVWFDATGIKGCLAAPLLDEAERCIGVLFLHFGEPAASLSMPDLEFAKAVVAKYAVVIGRAKVQVERSRMLISERRARVRAERQAAELSALLQSLQEGVIVIDAFGNIVLRNKMERQISKVPDQIAVSILDYGNYRLLWPDNIPVPVQQLPGNRLLRGENLDTTEFVLEHSDGLRLNIICSGNVIRGEDGQIVLGIIITRDITEMRQLEESREAFVRTISHDLRNPLTVVSARSQLLQRRLIKQNLVTEADEAQVIYTSARRMTQMIQEMFDSYRLESNNLKLNKNMLDFAAVIKDLISRIGLEEDLKRLQVEIVPGDYRIYADEERLERVVTNLIANALKYSPSDRPVLVKLLSQANQITITVTDFGIGIDPQDLPKVFQRYYRSKNVKEATGLGLGLYIVKLIVEAHDGKIDVSSRLNEGSTFSITLPVLTEVGEKWEAGSEK